MIKQPFAVKGITHNKHMVRQLQAVLDTASDAVKQVWPKDPSWNPILIEDFGHTLEQRAWTDSHGVYVTYRLAPLDANNAKAKAIAELFEKKLGYVFHTRPQAQPTVEDVDGMRTVYLYGDISSKGD